MKTIRSELRKIGLTKDMSEPRVESNLETMLINAVSQSEVSTRRQMTRKGIKEKSKLYNCHEKHHGKPKTLYKKEGGEKRMPKVSEVKITFIKKLVKHLMNNEMRFKEMVEVMKTETSGEGTNKNAIRNFLSIAKSVVPSEFITNEGGLWRVDANISVDQFMTLFLQNMPKYWKKKHDQKPSSVVKPTKRNQDVSLSDLVQLLKNGVGVSITGKVDVNINFNLK